MWCVAWHPNGNLLASCGADKSIMLWSRDGGCVATLDDVHSRTVRRLAWSPNGRYLAAASFDGTCSVWSKDQDDGKLNFRAVVAYCFNRFTNKAEFDCIATLEGHENEVKGVAWSAESAQLATCGRDKTVWIWEGNDAIDAVVCLNA